MTKRLRRFEPRLNNAGGVASILLPHPTEGVVNVAENLFANRAGAVSPPCSALSDRSVAEGGLAPSPQKLKGCEAPSVPAVRHLLYWALSGLEYKVRG